MDFANKVVLITGASSGIGAACAIKFAKLSAKLSITGRNTLNLNKTAEECERLSGQRPFVVIADMSVDVDVEKIMNDTLNYYGNVDVLVNNAGTSVFARVLDGIEIFDKIMSVNLRGTYLLTSKILPHLVETKGNVVNISSMLSTTASPLMTAYCLSKAALDMFTKCIALEFAPKGVRVNSVNPGPVKTEIFKRAGMSEADNEKFFVEMETKTPLRKVPVGEDVAELVVFLASDKASCVTGSCYLIDCGLSIDKI